jgi:hypothetical protein
MDSLTDTLVAVMAGYAGPDLNGESFLTHSEDGNMLTVISIGDMRGAHFAVTNLVARLVGSQIVIEHDINNKPLVDALVAAGVPREHILLAYAGETSSYAA